MRLEYCLRAKSPIRRVFVGPIGPSFLPIGNNAKKLVVRIQLVLLFFFLFSHTICYIAFSTGYEPGFSLHQRFCLGIVTLIIYAGLACLSCNTRYKSKPVADLAIEEEGWVEWS